MRMNHALAAGMAFALGGVPLTSSATDAPLPAAVSSPAAPAASSGPAGNPTVSSSVSTPHDEDQFAERRAIEALDRIAYIFPFEQTKLGRVITLSTDDYFGAGSARFGDMAQRLEDLAAALREMGDHRIEINCYTDSAGDPAENDALSLKRAVAMEQYLVARGVDSGRLQARGMGGRHPVSDNGTSAGRAMNRRIEIVIEQARMHGPLMSRRD